MQKEKAITQVKSIAKELNRAERKYTNYDTLLAKSLAKHPRGLVEIKLSGVSLLVSDIMYETL